MFQANHYHVIDCLAFLCCSLFVLPVSLTGAELPRWINPNAETGSSAAVVVGDWPLAYTTQIFPTNDNGNIAAKNPAAQMEQVLDNLDDALSKAKSGVDRIVKLNIYLARQGIASDIERVLAKRFRGASKPAVALVVTRLPNPGALALVAADAVAMTTLDPGRSVNFVSKAGRDQRSQPVVSVSPNGSRIYVSGQAEQSRSLSEATRKTLESLRATLRFLGRGDADIVQLKAFLAPMSDASEVQREVTTFFGKQPVPPLVLVEWKASPTVPIEIELVAWGGKNHTGEAVEYLTPPGMKASPVYCRVARINHTRSIYVSGLHASPPSKRDADANSPQAGEREVKEIFTTLDRILKEAGSDFRHLAKATYYVSTDSASRKLNELRPNYYDPQRPPAASKAAVESVGRAGLGLTMDMIAVPISQ